MNNKYIIKNCPCYFDKPEANCWADQLSWCENCTDCILKQIVELCKGEQQSRVATNIISNKILKLLDIEEVE